MDFWLLLLTIVGTLAAIAAAVFSYPDWRERLLRPRLELRVRNLAGHTMSGPIVTRANLELEVHNAGKGEGQMWRVEVRSRGPGAGSLRLPDPRNPRPGEEQYQLPGRIEVLSWRAVDSNDVIAPRDRSRGIGPAMIELVRGEDFLADYSVTARGMKPRNGTITVSCQAPPHVSVT